MCSGASRHIDCGGLLFSLTLALIGRWCAYACAPQYSRRGSPSRPHYPSLVVHRNHFCQLGWLMERSRRLFFWNSVILNMRQEAAPVCEATNMEQKAPKAGPRMAPNQRRSWKLPGVDVEQQEHRTQGCRLWSPQKTPPSKISPNGVNGGI